MARFRGIRAPGASKRSTSAETAAAFLELRARRESGRQCCARFAWGDGTHDLDCPRRTEVR